MRYLTNVDQSEVTEFRTYVAALRSGQNVRYLNCPMPEAHSGYYHRNLEAGRFNNLACIVGIDNEHDYSKFWREWDKLKLDNLT